MKKKFIVFFIKIFCVVLFLGGRGGKVCFSQQVPHYSHYLFNNYGMNPAYASRSSCLEVKVGRRNQWVGFPNAPLLTFLGVNKVVGKKAFRTGWHSIGFYAEQDNQEIIKTEAFYPSYAYHMRLFKEYYASFGTFAGVRLMSTSFELNDPADPAFSNISNVLILPDITVGGRLYNKYNFFDFAVRQVYKNKVQFGSKKIGSPSKLMPHINFIAGRRIESNSYYYSYVPSVNVRLVPLAPPSVDLSFLMFIKKQIGFGLSYRYNDAVIGLLQYKWKNIISLAFAYDFTLSRMRAGTSHSREIMLGFTSCPPGQDLQKSTGCPAYDH